MRDELVPQLPCVIRVVCRLSMLLEFESVARSSVTVLFSFLADRLLSRYILLLEDSLEPPRMFVPGAPHAPLSDRPVAAVWDVLTRA